jgi:hypothetical protein
MGLFRRAGGSLHSMEISLKSGFVVNKLWRFPTESSKSASMVRLEKLSESTAKSTILEYTKVGKYIAITFFMGTKINLQSRYPVGV